MATTQDLHQAPRGSRWRLLEGLGTGSERLRFAHAGVRRGAELTLLSRTGGGGAVVAVGTYRLALDRAGLGRLRVEPLG